MTCPPELLGALGKHKSASRKLQTKFKILQKRLDMEAIDTNLRDDVTRNQQPKVKDLYYLHQPKAKQKKALTVGELVITKTTDGWLKAKLESKTLEYKDGSYMWTYHFLETGDACSSFLSPGDAWGVLRGEDVDLDFSRLEPQMPGGPRQRYRLESGCSECNLKAMDAFAEEATILEGRLPVRCSHQQLITGISIIGSPQEAEEVEVVRVPRPAQSQHRAPSAASSITSSTCSTVTIDRLEKHLAEVTSHFELFCTEQDNLCNELLRFPSTELPEELQEESLDEFLRVLTDRVTEITVKTERKLDWMRLESPEVFPEGPPKDRELSPTKVQEQTDSTGTSLTLVEKSPPKSREQGLFGAQAYTSTSSPPTTVKTTTGVSLATGQHVSTPIMISTTAPSQFTGQQLQQSSTADPLLSVTSSETPSTRAQQISVRPKSYTTAPSQTTGQQSPLTKNPSGILPAPGHQTTGQQCSLTNATLGSPPAPAQQSTGQQSPVTSAQRTLLVGQVEAARTRVQADLDDLREEIDKLPTKVTAPALAALTNMGDDIDKELSSLDLLLSQCVVGAPDQIGQGLEERLMLTNQLRDAKKRLRKQATGLTTADDSKMVPKHRTQLEKIKLPTFSGQLESWPDFLKTWADLTVPEAMTDATELLCLRQHIPPEAVELLEGVQDMKVAWERLKRKYGDRDLMILHVTKRLNSVTLAGPIYEQVEKLAQECERAVTLLTHFKASELLHNDFELVAKLSSKLPSTLLHTWDMSCRQRGGESPAAWPHFLAWLQEEREVAHFSRMRNLTKEASSAKGKSGGAGIGDPDGGQTCAKCHTQGHSARECPHPSTRDLVTANAGRFQTEAEYLRDRPGIAKRSGKCPTCGGEHTYQRQMAWGKVDFPSSCFADCPTWKGATVEQRAEAVEKAKACAQCTSWNHGAERCWFRRKVECPASVGGSPCKKAHHLLLHNSGSTYCVAALQVSTNAAPITQRKLGKKARQRLRRTQKNQGMTSGGVVKEEVHSGEPVILDTQELIFRPGPGKPHGPGHVFWDSGSTGSLCTHRWATERGLRSQPVTYYLQVVGQGASMKRTNKYFGELVDRQGGWHQVHFLGIETLTSCGELPDLRAVRHLFPNVPDETFVQSKRPVEVLLGKNFTSLMPRGGTVKENLQMMESKFGSGHILSGWSSLLQHPSPNLTPSAQMLASATEARVGAVVDPTPVISAHLRTHTFLELEELGAAPRKYCKKCVSCTQCSYRGQSISRDQEAVVRSMEDSLERDLVTGQLTISYPFLPCTERMRDNSRQAIAIQTKVEARLERDNLLEKYNEEMKKMIERGAVVPLVKEDLEYQGPIHYITHFGVLNPESKSTPLRIVSNSASKNQHSGLSFNDCTEDGPNTLNGLLQVLLGWRSLEVGLLYDLSKAYQKLRTRIQEKNLRRLVWRPKPGDAWTHFGYDCANFGDKLAPLALELGKKRTAEEGESIDSMAADQLLTLTYVDDNCGGGGKEDVKRMVGGGKFGKEPGTISKILATCRFEAKAFVTSGMQGEEEAGALGEKVLGVGYVASTDKINMKLKPVMLTPGSRVRTATMATKAMIASVLEGTSKMTKRMALSFVNGQYDPLGLIAPINLKNKIKLKMLYCTERRLEWDEPLEEPLRRLWAESLAEAEAMKMIQYHRAVRPAHAKGQAWLVGFADGSTQAYGAAIYARWEVEEPGLEPRVEVRLVLGKSRVTPLAGTTAPRSEAQAAVILSRLILLVSKSVRFQVKTVTLASDSEAFIAATEKSGGVLGPYLASRCSEFHLNIEEMKEMVMVEPLQHVPGCHNIADLATRGNATVEEVGPDSEWQNGPEYLKLERCSWPFSREFCREVPPDELRRRGVTSLAMAAARLDRVEGRLSGKIEEIMRHASTLGRAESVAARMMRGLFSPGPSPEVRRELARVEPGVKDLEAARQVLLLCSMGPSVRALEDGRLLSLGAVYERGLVVMKGRLPRHRLAVLLGHQQLPVLEPNTRLAYLILRQSHEVNHRKSFRAVVAESRQFAWIIRAGSLAKKIIRECMVCRLERKKRCSQKMGELPERMTMPSPCFTHVSCDLFGPFLCRGMGNTRARMKVWGAVFVCEATRALAVLAVGGYSTAAFLDTYNRFTALRGDPSTVLSDHGSQLLAAARQVDATITSGIDWEKVSSISARSGTTWQFSAVGCPWRNPLAERMVGLVKETLQRQLGGNEALDYAQLDTLFAVVARIVNDRPLGIQLLDEGDFSPITCNDLLLKRSPRSGWKSGEEVSPVGLLYAQEHLVRAWWDEWFQRVFPSLLPYQKWKVAHRNVRTGDIVLVHYPGKVKKGDYRLAKVQSVSKDECGQVRSVSVALRPRNVREKALPYRSKALTIMPLAVQRLVVLLPMEEQEEQLRKQEEEEVMMRRAGLTPIKEMKATSHHGVLDPGDANTMTLEEQDSGKQVVQLQVQDGNWRSSSRFGGRASRRLRGLVPERVGAVIVGYESEDDFVIA